MPRLILETHGCAPELNRAHILRRGRVVAIRACPGAATIRDARAFLWPRIAAPFRFATYESRYDTPDRAWLDRAYSGRVASYAAALIFLRQQRDKLATGGAATIRTRLIG